MNPQHDSRKDPAKQVRKPRHPALEAIEEAMERGDFDNLPGKGKPLNLDPKEVSDPIGIANGIRRNANLGSPWEALQREIDLGAARAETELEAAYAQRQASLQRARADATAVEKRWQAALANYEKSVEQLNSKILTFNLTIPRHLPHLYKRRIQVADTLERLGIGA